MSTEDSNYPSFKTEILIILSTAYYNLSIGFLIIFFGFHLPNTEWYKPLYFIIGLIIMSYPFFHTRDRLKDKSLQESEKVGLKK